MTTQLNPDLDLVISRVIKAPAAAVWDAWTNPAKFEQWWVPHPTVCRVLDMDLRPGGSFRTEISEHGVASNRTSPAVSWLSTRVGELCSPTVS